MNNISKTIALALLFSGVAVSADILGAWNFNSGATTAQRLASSNQAAGVSNLSALTFNTFDDVGPGLIPNSVHDGIGFDGNRGEQVAFIRRANYFNTSGVPPKENASNFTSFGLAALQGTGAALGNGNAPVWFTITAGPQALRIDSLTVGTTSTNAPLIVSFQEAGTQPTQSITLNSGNLVDTASLSSSITFSAGQTKTFSISLNSNSLSSFHVVNEFVLNGAVVPEPATYALFGGLFALGWVMLRCRR